MKRFQLIPAKVGDKVGDEVRELFDTEKCRTNDLQVPTLSTSGTNDQPTPIWPAIREEKTGWHAQGVEGDVENGKDLRRVDEQARAQLTILQSSSLFLDPIRS
jgi:hypothetical protein